MPESLLGRALEYASWGWRIFPLLPRDKKPFPGSHGFADATTDPAIIRDWWTRTPQANIGLATGPGSGVIVVDLDVNADKGKDGLAEWLAMPGVNETHSTAHSMTGGGGYHLFFLCDNPIIRNRVLSKSIDIRGDGGYVVLPGSIHPNGNEYKWIDHPESVAPAPLPDWLLPKGNLVGLVDTTATASRKEAMEAFERCERYVATLPPAISGAGGSSATLRVAAECFRFGLTESQAWDILSRYNTGQCQPAWSEKELRHKLREGKKLVDREGKFGKRLDEGNYEADWPVTHRITVIEDEPEIETPAKSTFPEYLLSPPGVVGDICKWINETAYKPQPILALANSLAFWGAVLGRRARTPSDLRTNLYCLGVGESGCGKDHSRKAIKKLCDAAAITGEVLGGEELASDSAIMASVYKASTSFGLNGILFQLDEIGHMLSIVNSKFAAGHMQNISPTFMRLFSSANTVVIGKEFAQRSRQDIPQPTVCLYGTTVPDRLFGGLSKNDVTNGFLGRMLVFISDEPDPAESEKEMQDPPESVLRAIKFWRENVTREHAGNMAGRGPAKIPFDDEANQEIGRFVRVCAEEKAATRDGSGLDVLWSRAPEHARKVALVLACGDLQLDSDGKLTKEIRVSRENSIRSVTLIDHLTRSLIAAIGENMADSDFERQLQKVLKAIGRSAISRKLLSQRTREMHPRVRQEVIRELLETNRIEMVEKMSSETAKRPLQLFRRTKDEGCQKVAPSRATFILPQPSQN